MCHLRIKSLSFWVLLTMVVTQNGQVMQTRAPLFSNKPFTVLWNAPTDQCRLRYKVDLDLHVFDIQSNANEALSGSTVTIFYHNRFGYYPYFNDSGVSFNGGIPQNQSLVKHLFKVKSDIDHSIPVKKFHGLGVIDWENWRPQWDRNWGHKVIYKKKSVQLIRKEYPQWPLAKSQEVAKEEFEKAGRSFMNSTLFLAKDMRPNGLWGYYLYPDCYNYGYKNNLNTYTGQCPDIEYTRNDLLIWLWKESTALYPSIYLDYTLRSSTNALKFVHHRVKEAIRIASIARKDYALPVYVYSRPFYAYTLEALTEEDLVHTIGESAALGAAGVVLWGSTQYANSYDNCVKVKKYVDGPLGHYVINVTTAAKLCSKVLCKKNGRCIRKNSDSNDFLHLRTKSYNIQFDEINKKVFVKGRLKSKDIWAMKEKFMCQCYQGWTGKFCQVHCSKNGCRNYR